MWAYTRKMLRIYYWNLWQWLNRRLLHTYPDIEECCRCRDCGRNVHDWHAPDGLFEAVIGIEDGVWCWDCFCARAEHRGLRVEARVNRTKKEKTP